MEAVRALLPAVARAACAGDAPQPEPAARATAARSSAAKPAPLPAAEDRAGWHALLRWPADCEERRRVTNGADPGAGIRVDTLGAGRHLVQVQCDAGAYQPGHLIFVHEPGRAATPLRLPGRGEGGFPEDTLPYVDGLPAFDAATREFEVFSKPRGIGDCGNLVRFAFPRGVPTVKWHRARECPVEPRFVEPGKWPLLPPDSGAAGR